MEYILYAAIGIFTFKILYRLFSNRTVKIAAPKLGFLDLSDGAAIPLVSEDKAALSPLFDQVVEGDPVTGTISDCDVLLIYGDISSDATLSERKLSAEKILEGTNAPIVFFVTDNEGDDVNSISLDNVRDKSIVYILERKGECFAHFMTQLFTMMKQGTSMPIAWVKLAPQYESADHSELPEAFCSMGAGQVVFE